MHRKDLTPKKILDKCKKDKITQVLCMFPDILGQPCGQQTVIEEMGKAFKRGVLIDGSSLDFFSRVEESDFRAIPDPQTFHVLPWEIGEEKAGIVICDVVMPDGRPFEGDPRYILKRTLATPNDKDWEVNIGPELEYFYFKSENAAEVLDHAGYFQLVPDKIGLGLRTKVLAALRSFGIRAEVGHHEVAHSQHEIDLHYKPALEMADTILFYRWLVKWIADDMGFYATFMPKPIPRKNGSGMHVHQSIFNKNGKNLFSGKNSSQYHLSRLALQYLAGLLKYCPELTVVFNQSVNSYKRLVPGKEAPVNVCYGTKNRSAFVRIPDYEPKNPMARRLELRSPDPACNPYLAFACMIAAGLTGIEEKLEPPKPVEKDAYKLTSEELSKLKIRTLPADLSEALALFEGSKLARKILGDYAFHKFIENKRMELENWRLAVTDYEIREYLPVL